MANLYQQRDEGGGIAKERITITGSLVFFSEGKSAKLTLRRWGKVLAKSTFILFEWG